MKPEPAPAEAPMKTEPAAPEPAAPKPAPEAPAPAMSSALRAIQSLWRTLATERTPGNIEMYKLFRRLGSTIGSADLHVEDLRVIRRELWKFRKFMSHYKQFFGPCRLRVSVSRGIFCLTNLFAEVQARMYNASLAAARSARAVAFQANTWRREKRS